MQTPATGAESFNDLVQQFLGKRLPDHLADMISMSKLPPEAQGFIMRMFGFMKQAGYCATGFSPALIKWLSTTIPSVLPSAWGGRIPPITLPHRHAKFDAYMAAQHQTNANDSRVYIDVGCGFPPATTSETARHFPNWRIYGVDRSFADYVVYDSNGHYACFDENGGFRYFQAFFGSDGRALYADPEGTKKHFRRLFEELRPLIREPDSADSETVERKGNKLVHNHYRDFETENLSFVKADIMDSRLPSANVIRCMNVLVYFLPEVRKSMLQQMSALLDEDGMLIAGTNGLGIQSRYAVYHKTKDGIAPRQFACSLDNLDHIAFMPWFSIYANEPEAKLLAQLGAAIRADRSLWSEFSSRLDVLMAKEGICRRGADGFLQFPQEPMPIREYLAKNALIWSRMDEEGYGDRAVDVLQTAGYDAWRNRVGDIAVRPPDDCLP